MRTPSDSSVVVSTRVRLRLRERPLEPLRVGATPNCSCCSGGKRMFSLYFCKWLFTCTRTDVIQSLSPTLPPSLPWPQRSTDVQNLQCFELLNY